MSSVPCDLSASALSVSALSTGAARADALFASALQRSDEPSPGQVRRAIAAAVAAYGGSGCAARVAQAFGEHPETAVTRMRWARTLVARAIPATCLAAWAAALTTRRLNVITWGPAPPWSPRRRRWQGAS
jgi:hypothetical protein